MSTDWTAEAARLREQAENTTCHECRIDLLAEANDAEIEALEESL